MTPAQSTALRALPAVSTLIAAPEITSAGSGLDSEVITRVVRREIERTRLRLLAGDIDAGARLRSAIIGQLRLISGNESNHVINATGVIIQTNLGRAAVSEAAAAAMRDAAATQLALETELEHGQRGGRGSEVEALLRVLTGAESALVVNNNAAAVLLTLMATSSGRQVVVSRGEAVEIGGGFRIPDVLRQSGAELVEVGTTNRTYVADYAAAINDQTAALLKVHASNFAIVGFTTTPTLQELSDLAHERGVLALEDAGSGCLLDTTVYGITHEPMIAESVSAGVDVICASGDKLLGGPQAGIIIGRRDLVAVIARHPLARALRSDKVTLAGVAATLRHYARGEAPECIPVWWSIAREPQWLRERVERWRDQLGGRGDVVATDAVVGGGTLPGRTLPSFALAFDGGEGGADKLARTLRVGTPHVVPRVDHQRVLVDARTVLPRQDAPLLEALQSAFAIA